MNYLKDLGRILLLILALGLLGRFHKVVPRIMTILSSQKNVLHLGQPRDISVPVFMYHHVGPIAAKPDIYSKDLTVSSSDFADQVKYLRDHGYGCVSTADLYKYQLGQIELEKKPCVIIFDDGFDDVFQNALPVLKSNGMVGVFAIITKYPGTPQYASWQTIVNASKEGMEIIPHSQHHIDFASMQYSYAQKEAEIKGSINDIYQNVGREPLAFVYPYGRYDANTERILKDSSIKMAFTTEYGNYESSTNPVVMRRIRVHGGESVRGFANSIIGAQGR
ncbi:MAG: polysaccharide deacetylase family protein [Candidatus Doudnabacteria bacterium]